MRRRWSEVQAPRSQDVKGLWESGTCADETFGSGWDRVTTILKKKKRPRRPPDDLDSASYIHESKKKFVEPSILFSVD